MGQIHVQSQIDREEFHEEEEDHEGVVVVDDHEGGGEVSDHVGGGEVDDQIQMGWSQATSCLQEFLVLQYVASHVPYAFL